MGEEGGIERIEEEELCFFLKIALTCLVRRLPVVSPYCNKYGGEKSS